MQSKLLICIYLSLTNIIQTSNQNKSSHLYALFSILKYFDNDFSHQKIFTILIDVSYDMGHAFPLFEKTTLYLVDPEQALYTQTIESDQHGLRITLPDTPCDTKLDEKYLSMHHTNTYTFDNSETRNLKWNIDISDIPQLSFIDRKNIKYFLEIKIQTQIIPNKDEAILDKYTDLWFCGDNNRRCDKLQVNNEGSIITNGILNMQKEKFKMMLLLKARKINNGCQWRINRFDGISVFIVVLILIAIFVGWLYYRKTKKGKKIYK